MRETLRIGALALLVGSVGAVSALSACGGTSTGGTSSPEPPSAIARIHRTRCGACHVRVEPGERTRAELETALGRHHKRVHLTDEQWGEMIDYLAAPPDAGTSAGDAQ